jgi:hypothetical protein
LDFSWKVRGLKNHGVLLGSCPLTFTRSLIIT